MVELALAAVFRADLIQSLPDSLSRVSPADVGGMEILREYTHPRSSVRNSLDLILRQPVCRTSTLRIRGSPKCPMVGKAEKGHGANRVSTKFIASVGPLAWIIHLKRQPDAKTRDLLLVFNGNIPPRLRKF